MRVRDLMHGTPVPTVRAEDNLALASQIMLWAGARHLPVLRGRSVVGVISEGDILRRQARLGVRESAREPVASAMSSPAEVIDAEAEVPVAVARMADRGVSCLPVMVGDTLVGIVTGQDLLGQQGGQPSGVPPERGSERAVDVMTPFPEVTSEEENLIDAAARMREKQIRHLPVVDLDGRVIGMLSDRDVRAAIGDPRRAPVMSAEAAAHVRSMTIGQAMTAPPRLARHDENVTALARHFLDWRVGALPVVGNDQRLLGVVSYLDLLAALYPTAALDMASRPGPALIG